MKRMDLSGWCVSTTRSRFWAFTLIELLVVIAITIDDLNRYLASFFGGGFVILNHNLWVNRKANIPNIVGSLPDPSVPPTVANTDPAIYGWPVKPRIPPAPTFPSSATLVFPATLLATRAVPMWITSMLLEPITPQLSLLPGKLPVMSMAGRVHPSASTRFLRTAMWLPIKGN